MFSFQNPGRLIDHDLELVLMQEVQGNPQIGFVPTHIFEMWRIASKQKIGRIEIRIGNTHHLLTYAGHIGCFVQQEHRGHRYAARSCKLLFPLARSHELDALWITCNPDNIAALRTCELIGGELIEIIDLPEDTNMYYSGELQKCRYRIQL